MMRPVPPEPPPGTPVPYGLTDLLVDGLWELSSRSEIWRSPQQLSWNDLYTRGFLEALAAARIEGAAELVQAVKTHGTVEVWIE